MNRKRRCRQDCVCRLLFKALPGTLPRLRYGRSYWLRARAVDLAGNSLAPQPDDFGTENPEDNDAGLFPFRSDFRARPRSGETRRQIAPNFR